MSVSNRFENLARRKDFNISIAYMQLVLKVSDRIKRKENLADIATLLLATKVLSAKDCLPLVSALLSDKFSYASKSINIRALSKDCLRIADTVSKWNAVDLVLVYQHPDLGPLLINPKNALHMSSLGLCSKNELITVYAGAFANPLATEKAHLAITVLLALIQGDEVPSDNPLQSGSCLYKKVKIMNSIQAPAKDTKKRKQAVNNKKGTGYTWHDANLKHSNANALSSFAQVAPTLQKTSKENPATSVLTEGVASAGTKITPTYSVAVTNELFHNGNVEAWKRIINSYLTKHPGLKIFVYYEGEHISDINALFKWGKVKHGSSIQFAVAGDAIADVAKLQRYLAQGASSNFEAFLGGPVNSIMNLF